MIGAAHAGDMVADRLRQACGHRAPAAVQFLEREIDATAGAASAAMDAGIAVTHGRFSPAPARR